jgi:hypothetical protein
MTARAKVSKATKAEAKTLGAALARAVTPTADETAQLLRSQCLALACSIAGESDDTESIIRDAERCYDWIKNAKVPRKPNIRAVT